MGSQGRRLALRLLWIVLSVALVGEAGHILFERLHQELAHHLFHMLVGGGAALVFSVYLWLEVRRNGWPSFTWRLRPDPPNWDPPHG